ncbi:macro domain-containing protein [Actinoplanes sp. NPDC048988]|uniref:macro domain-containing protein n=1 Tax=Actinoplanes sp. NPDC048988 TaxID=3363901 RepID=UPI00371D4B48
MDAWNAPGHVVRREERTAVQKRVLEIRRAIDPPGTGPAGSLVEQLSEGRTAYRLLVPAHRIDFVQFRHLVEQAAREDGVIAIELLRKALSLWRGRPFAAVEQLPFARPLIDDLWAMRRTATLELIEIYRQMGRPGEALAAAEALAADRPGDAVLLGLITEIRAALRRQRRGLLRLTVGDRATSTVVLSAGDLFAERDAHLVVGFTDTFDTDTTDDRVINGASMQARAARELFAGDRGALDRQLRAALRDVRPASRETRAVKRRGKLVRYPLGTVAVLRPDDRCLFAVAYSRMGNDLVARSTPADLAVSLDSLWEAIRLHGQLRPVAVPLIGGGLSRIDESSPDDLLRLVIKSFERRSRSTRICPELRIVLRSEDLARVDFRALRTVTG